MGASFRSYVWDPMLLISQIIAMQSVFYVCFGIWLIMVDYILDHPKSLSQIFGYDCLDFSSSGGRMIVAVYVMNALTCAIGLWCIVQRTKQCTDFSVTMHFFHFIACWMYNSWIPSSMAWWFTNIGCIALTTVLGEYLCMRTELKDIPLTGARADL
ncbi:protein SYS1 homolog [Lytechinus pictus]|uniref:protein SYS1 homolog n=1 Tax=Lytechinus pictus TaxID=7653 RepID=UPI00240E0487|nr:protein SYS1 homolog [Lytechinus pictus]XP_054765350.1 protein SYS1 homolog [Lytechinus pictus]